MSIINTVEVCDLNSLSTTSRSFSNKVKSPIPWLI
ncbi:F-box protein [uncultured Microscilla sp.]